MRSEIKGAVLAGALTLSGMGGLPKPAIAETNLPQSIVEPNKTAPRLGTENPTLVFNQEVYTPNEGDAKDIRDVSSLILGASSDPEFVEQMMERYYSDFESYFGIHRAIGEFGFRYSPFGKENPVLVDYFGARHPAIRSDGKEFTYIEDRLSIVVGDDLTLATPATSGELISLDEVPQMIESNVIIADGVEQIPWDFDITDPMREIAFKEITLERSAYYIAGDTTGEIFLGTYIFEPVEAQ